MPGVGAGRSLSGSRERDRHCRHEGSIVQVLYIASVHYRSPRWIEIQTRHIREHISVAHQTWSSLEGIDPSYAAHFDRILEQRGSHAGKLNHMAMEICQ